MCLSIHFTFPDLNWLRTAFVGAVRAALALVGAVDAALASFPLKTLFTVNRVNPVFTQTYFLIYNSYK